MMSTTPDVTITGRAAQKVYTLLASEQNFNLNLRVYIEGGGCSGLQYCFTFDPEIRDTDWQQTVAVPMLANPPTEDAYSATALGMPEDFTIEGSPSIQVLIDHISYSLVAGATIDYVIDTTGQHFAVTNPNAKGSCSCGSSFSA